MHSATDATSAAPTEHRDYWSKYQPETTTLVWGCGHTAAVRLALNPIVAADQIAAYSQIDCLPCAKAKKAQTRGILWADVQSGAMINGTTRIGIRNEAIICDHCDSTEGPFRETFHGSAICVDSETCASRWMRRFGHRKGNEARA